MGGNVYIPSVSVEVLLQEHQATMNMETERTPGSVKRRCKTAEAQIQALPTAKITQSCKDRLVKLVQAELNSLSRLPISSDPISTNIGYVESILYVVQQSGVSGVTCVCKTIQGERPFSTELRSTHVDIVGNIDGKPVWFIVSSRNPKYISWSCKCNRKGLKARLDLLLEAALATIILQPISIVLCFAHGIEEIVSQRLKEEFGAVEVFYFKQRNFVIQNKTEECPGMRGTSSQFNIFQDVEGGEWVNILGIKEMYTECARNDYECGHAGSSNRNQDWVTFEIKIDQEDSIDHKYLEYETGKVICGDKKFPEHNHIQENGNLGQLDNLSGLTLGLLEECTLPLDKKFCSLLAAMDALYDKPVDDKGIISLKNRLINLDTTALVALVSGLSNGSAKKLVEMSEQDLNNHFKNTANFMREQAKSELEHPLLEDVISVLEGKKAMICDYTHEEFKNLISMCSGPNEKRRAECLLKRIVVLPNKPSVRVMGLPDTGKIKLKHKLIFGTGDHWQAPTLTANMGFVRAVTQTGMSLLVLEHRPRALIGD